MDDPDAFARDMFGGLTEDERWHSLGVWLAVCGEADLETERRIKRLEQMLTDLHANQ